jgi:hypothetical protein
MNFTIHEVPARNKRMRKVPAVVASLFLTLILAPVAIQQARAQSEPYPAMAPLKEYLMPKDAEIALARSAAPASISDGATVMVLAQLGYTDAVQGTNGFVCLVERSWANTTDSPEFWNPKARAPHCFNPQAAKSFAQIYLMKSRLVLAGKSKAETARAIAAALDRKELPPLAPGSMCYMMSSRQYLNDQGKSWHPHLMFFAAGDATNSWGANLGGSPVMAANDPEARVTTFMVLVDHWSDGTPDPH